MCAHRWFPGGVYDTKYLASWLGASALQQQQQQGQQQQHQQAPHVAAPLPAWMGAVTLQVRGAVQLLHCWPPCGRCSAATWHA